eukprot:gene16981-22478_t
MEYKVEEKHIIWLIMGYLRDRGFSETLSSLCLETSLSHSDCDHEHLLYIQKLTLIGSIYKQQYLEALSWLGDGGHRHALLPWRPNKLSIDESSLYDTEQLHLILKNLENMCDKQEFEILCNCLTLDKLSDCSIYSDWTVSQGRLETFQSIKSELLSIYPSSNKSNDKVGLLTVLAMSLLNQEKTSGSISSRSALWDLNEQIPTIVNNRLVDIPAIIITNPISNELFKSNVIRNDVVDPLESTDESKETQEIISSNVNNRNHVDIQEIKTKQPENISTNIKDELGPPYSSRKPKTAAVSWTVDVAPNISSRRPSEPAVSPPNRPVRQRPTSQPRGVRAQAAVTQVGDDSASMISKISKDSQNTTSRQSRKTPPPLPITTKHKISQSTTSPWDIEAIPQHTVVYQAACPLRCVSVLFRHKPDACTVAIGSNNRSVHLLHVPLSDAISSNVEEIHEYKDVHKGSIYAMDYNHSAGLLVTASNDKSLKIHNVSTGSWSLPLKGHTATIRVVRCRNSAIDQAKGVNVVASAGAGDCRTRLWDINTGSCFNILPAHEDMVHGLLWVDENTIISGCDKGVSVCHDIRTGQSIWTSSSTAGVCTYSRYNDNIAVVGYTGGDLSLIDLSTGRILLTERVHQDDIRSISTLYQGSSPPLIISTSFDSSVAIWRANSSHNKLDNVAILSGGHSDKVLDVSTIPGSEQQFLTSGADGKVILWKPPR